MISEEYIIKYCGSQNIVIKWRRSLGGELKMIVYYKLANILKERNMQWKDLCNAGISINTPTKFSQNRSMNTDIIDKVCEYLQVQPCDIMEWISLEDYEKMQKENNSAEKAKIKQQIAELQAKLNAMQ